MKKHDTGARIRRAVETDRENLMALMVRAFADVRERQSGEVLERTWTDWETKHVQTMALSRVVLAEVAGNAVGFATYELDGATRIGTVSDNAVLPEYRGRGIGRQLLARVLGLIEESGMEFAQVSTGLEGPYAPARRMYERQGFRPLSRSVLYAKKLAQNVGMTAETAEVSIRRAVESDRETLIELIVRAFADVTVYRWCEEQFGTLGGRSWKEWEADLMRSIDISRVIIAEVAGNAVGFATYELDDATRIGNVSDNAVLPEYRNRGIGGRLLARVLDEMKAAGMEFVQVSTGLENSYVPARRMYERQGFEPFHRSVHYMKRIAQSSDGYTSD